MHGKFWKKSAVLPDHNDFILPLELNCWIRFGGKLVATCQRESDCNIGEAHCSVAQMAWHWVILKHIYLSISNIILPHLVILVISGVSWYSITSIFTRNYWRFSYNTSITSTQSALTYIHYVKKREDILVGFLL